jgi:hypothetical protein
MEIEYNVDLDDFVAYYSYQFDRLPNIQRQIKTYQIICIILGNLCLLMGIGCWIVFSLLDWSDDFTSILFILLVIIGIFSLINSYFFKAILKKRFLKNVRKQYSEGKGVITGNVKMSISENGIHIIHKIEDAKTSWAAVKEIDYNAQYLFFIFLGSLSALVVPKRAFPYEAAFNQFYETAKSYHKAALESAVKADN